MGGGGVGLQLHSTKHESDALRNLCVTSFVITLVVVHTWRCFMVGSKFDLNGLCFDQLKQRERLCVLFCFPSFVMKLGEKNVKTADSLSLLLDRQFMELSFIS